MNKPLSVNMNDTKMALANICNQSQLPMCILELIVRDIYEEIHLLAEQRLKQEEELYKKNILNKEQNKKNEDIGESNE